MAKKDDPLSTYQAKEFYLDGKSNIYKQLNNYRLTTAEIIYRLPDHPSILQHYIWQELDIAPRFPILRKFLNFWEKSLEGKLYMVKVAHQTLISAGELAYSKEEFLIQ